MITPTIHMNGDTAKTLTGQWKAVYTASNALLEALRLARPHGRNFYPQGEQAISIAQNEHQQREQAVLTIVEDIGKMMKAIRAQSK
jgi:hypothetical protein